MQDAESTAVAFAAILHALVLIPVSLTGLIFLWLFQVAPQRRMLQP